MEYTAEADEIGMGLGWRDIGSAGQVAQHQRPSGLHHCDEDPSTDLTRLHSAAGDVRRPAALSLTRCDAQQTGRSPPKGFLSRISGSRPSQLRTGRGKPDHSGSFRSLQTVFSLCAAAAA
jgi:hypothetical protein